MKFPKLFNTLIVVQFLFVLNGCGGSGGGADGNPVAPVPTPAPTPINLAPTATAGNDLVVDENTSVTLSGNGSDSDGAVSSYSWIQVSGVNVTLSVKGAVATFEAPITLQTEVLEFELTVTDDDAAAASDVVQVIVNPVNTAPIITASTSSTAREREAFDLTANATDEDGTIIDFEWKQVAGIPVALVDDYVKTRFLIFTPPAVSDDEIIIFELVVTDNEGAKSSHVVEITIQEADSAPHVKLKEKMEVYGGYVLNVIHTISDDYHIDNVEWSSASDELEFSVKNPSISTVSIPIVDRVTVYNAELQVLDDLGQATTKQIEITVLPGNFREGSRTAYFENSRSNLTSITNYPKTNEFIASFKTSSDTSTSKKAKGHALIKDRLLAKSSIEETNTPIATPDAVAYGRYDDNGISDIFYLELDSQGRPKVLTEEDTTVSFTYEDDSISVLLTNELTNEQFSVDLNDADIPEELRQLELLQTSYGQLELLLDPTVNTNVNIDYYAVLSTTINIGGCVAAVAVAASSAGLAVPLAVYACSSAVVSTAALINPDNEALVGLSYAFDSAGCAVIGDPTACASMGLDAVSFATKDDAEEFLDSSIDLVINSPSTEVTYDINTDINFSGSYSIIDSSVSAEFWSFSDNLINTQIGSDVAYSFSSSGIYLATYSVLLEDGRFNSKSSQVNVENQSLQMKTLRCPLAEGNGLTGVITSNRLSSKTENGVCKFSPPFDSLRQDKEFVRNGYFQWYGGLNPFIVVEAIDGTSYKNNKLPEGYTVVSTNPSVIFVHDNTLYGLKCGTTEIRVTDVTGTTKSIPVYIGNDLGYFDDEVDTETVRCSRNDDIVNISAVKIDPMPQNVYWDSEISVGYTVKDLNGDAAPQLARTFVFTYATRSPLCQTIINGPKPKLSPNFYNDQNYKFYYAENCQFVMINNNELSVNLDDLSRDNWLSQSHLYLGVDAYPFETVYTSRRVSRENGPIPTYTLSISIEENETELVKVTSSDGKILCGFGSDSCIAQYTWGSGVTLSVETTEGHTLASWGIENCSNQNNSCEITIVSEIELEIDLKQAPAVDWVPYLIGEWEFDSNSLPDQVKSSTMLFNNNAPNRSLGREVSIESINSENTVIICTFGYQVVNASGVSASLVLDFNDYECNLGGVTGSNIFTLEYVQENQFIYGGLPVNRL